MGTSTPSATTSAPWGIITFMAGRKIPLRSVHALQTLLLSGHVLMLIMLVSMILTIVAVCVRELVDVIEYDSIHTDVDILYRYRKTCMT